MTSIARSLATPFAVGLVGLVATAAVADETATIRHDVRLVALGLFAVAFARALARIALLLVRRRQKPSMPDLRYRTPAPRSPRLSPSGPHDLGA